MAIIKANGLDVFYTEQGAGDETIVFAHGLLMDTSMWDAVAPEFANHYRVICFDFRGQGQTSDPGHGHGYDIDTLVRDTAAFIQAISTKPVHYVGLSMGGMVGLPLAARHAYLLKSLVLLDTSAQAEPWSNKIKYAIMTVIVKVFGPKPLVPAMLPLIFGKSSLKNPAVREVISYWKQKLLALPKTIVGPVSGVTKRRDVTNELSKITCPTLMVVGDEDRTTPLSNANNIAAHIANTDLKIIPECGHSSALEKPEQVVALMKQFYSRLS
ncbi:MAG: alpha/beta fold hydrolase [Arenimonas sp.]